MKKIRTAELCRRLKRESGKARDSAADRELRLCILDYFISHDPSDGVFEEALEARLGDPDPAKERSKVICAQILEAWQRTRDDR